jgi:hypothetical protein
MKLLLFLAFDFFFSWLFISLIFHLINWILDMDKGSEPRYPGF